MLNLCTDESIAEKVFSEQLPAAVLMFEPPEDTFFPQFRLLPDTNLPTSLSTNTFGFRGPDIKLNKPDGVIRIAFVGGSTTVNGHGDVASYPERVGHWLSRWSNANDLEVTFEIVNAGRSGFGSQDIAALVRTELLPLEPDLVVYYEGSNQFYFANLIELEGDSAAERQKIPKTLQEANEAALRDPFNWVMKYSAIARRVLIALGHLEGPEVAEAPKPRHRLNWPDGVAEFDPDIDILPTAPAPHASAELPLSLNRILKDMDAIRITVRNRGGELVMSSFVDMIFDGMKMDPVRDANFHHSVNSNWRYWPASYAEVRRMADFQNRVFRKYAAIHQLPLLDIDAHMPRDPRFTGDGVHMDWEGIRLRAWITFNELVPVLKERIDAGLLPQPDRELDTQHPALIPPRLVTWYPCHNLQE